MNIIKYIAVALVASGSVAGAFAQEPSRDVKAMAAVDGQLWAAPANGVGLVRFEAGVWRKAPDADAALQDQGVTALAAVHGRLYAGTGHGLAVKNGSAWSAVPIPVSGTIGVTALAADGDALMINTSAGLFRLDAPGGVPKLYLGNGRPAGVVGGTGAAVRDVRIFPPPDGTAPVVEPGQARSSDVPAGRADDAIASRDPAWWTKVAKPGRPQPAFFKDILPVMVKECMPCHTSGIGKYFPLNDPQTVIRYFKNGGLSRFEQFLEEGGGMAGKVAPKTAKLIHIWVVDGCRE